MQSLPALRLVCWGVFLVVAGADALIASPISLGLLYFAPLALAALRLPGRDAVALVGAGTGAHLLLGSSGNPLGLEPLALHMPAALATAANGVVSSVAYAAVALLLMRLREQQQRIAALGKEVARDALTGVGNRRALAHLLAEQQGRQLALMLLDVDFFKRVNDTWGHAAGDRVLRELAARLVASVRHGDWVVRAGGEEFVVGLPGADAPTAREVAGRVLDSVRGQPFEVSEGVQVQVTASIGLAVGRASDALLHEADCALYQAKSAGRDRAHEALAPPPVRPLRAGEAR